MPGTSSRSGPEGTKGQGTEGTLGGTWGTKCRVLPPFALTPGGVYDLAYDPLTGRLAAITTPAGDALSFGHDGALATSTTWSGAVAGSVEVDHDDDLRVAGRTVNGANPVGFGYDGDSLLDQVTLPGGEILTVGRHPDHGRAEGFDLGVVTTAIVYNGFGERQSDQAFAGATLLYENVYVQRDRLGRIRTKVETIEGVTTTTAYTYDPAGRLDTVTVDGQLVRDYDYDPNGNRLRELPGGPVIASHDAQDRLLSRGTVTYAYDEHGDLETRTDAATGEVTTYGYDLLGSLTAVGLPDGRQITYVIDGLGRRVGKRVDGVLTEGWLYADALNPVAELDDAGTVVSRFVYGSRGHVPDAMIRNGTVYAIVSDHLGSVRLVVDTTTGDVMQRLDYDAWGNVTAQMNPGFQSFGFAGGLYDPDTKLVRFGARDYDAVAGRWNSKDPVRFDSTGTNLYGYVVNDPVNRIDRTGLIPGAPGEPPLRKFCEQMIPPECPGDESDVRERRIQACITEAALAGADAATNVGGSPPSTAVNIIQKIVESLPRSVQRLVRRLAE